MTMKKVLIVDTFAFLYRAFYASENMMKNTTGNNVGALSGFFSTVLYLLKQTSCTHVVFVSDSSHPSKRKLAYPEYKANRDKIPDDLRLQVQMVANAFEKGGIAVQKMDLLEADDIIVYLAEEFSKDGFDVVIASGDKDILQVVSDEKHISLMRPPSFGSKWTLYKEDEVASKYGIEKDSMASYLALLGDSSDNVPGVKGIGEKSAVSLLTEYKTLDGVYENIDKITKPKLKNALIEGKDDAYLSYSLVVLGKEEYKKVSPDDFDIKKISFAPLALYLQSLGVKTVSERIIKWASEMNLVKDNEADALVQNELPFFTSTLNVSQCDDFERDFALNKIIAVYTTPSSPVFYYAVNDKQACKVSAEDNKVKAVISAFLKEQGNVLVGFDIKSILKKYCIVPPSEIKASLADINIMAYLTDSETNIFSKNFLAEKYLSMRVEDSAKTKKQRLLFDEDNDDDALLAPLSYALLPHLINDLQKNDLYSSYLTLEEKIIPVLSQMENNGIYLDTAALDRFKNNLSERISIAEEKIYALAGKKFNISSPSQTASILFDTLLLGKGKKNKTGYSVDASVLEDLKGEHPIVELIMEYRGLSKLKNTYTDSLSELIDKQDNRLHTTFLQTGTATGRFSSVHPNLQNIPIRSDEGRLIRSAFKATSGNVLVSADYAQIELAVLAHFCEDEKLTDMFIHAEDVHRMTASLIFKKPKEDVTPTERRIAKTINFGVIYGMSAFRLAGELGIKLKEANDFLSEYFNTFSGVRSFIDKSVESVRANGYTTTLLGHKRYFPHINDSNKNIRSAEERAAVNSIIQGSAADIIKKAMVDISIHYEQRDDVKLLLNVHDELIFEMSKKAANSEKEVIASIMTECVHLRVPLRVSVESASSWGEMH